MDHAVTPVAEAPAAQRPGLSRWLPLALLLLAMGAAAAIWLRRAGDGTGFDYYGQWIGSPAPDFELTDQDGRPERLSAMRGNLVLMTFGFTHCPNICPTTLANLAAICRALPAAEQDRVRVLFISVDPARDTPKALKEYVGFYARGFMGLTGSADAIAKVAKDYGAYYEAVMQDSQVASNYYTINHSAYVYLVDPQGRYALLYNNDKLTGHAQMTRDIEHLLAEAPEQ